ncbi:unnamed protein product [Allacma fusca]|uniref:Uncharacterized protein n=1 Tax=Allacma fusca TaxID=39272 RepID=A0A8J2NLB7_9HEXA|nr:unnamed protein product [Allacma fusca]
MFEIEIHLLFLIGMSQLRQLPVDADLVHVTYKDFSMWHNSYKDCLLLVYTPQALLENLSVSTVPIVYNIGMNNAFRKGAILHNVARFSKHIKCQAVFLLFINAIDGNPRRRIAWFESSIAFLSIKRYIPRVFLAFLENRNTPYNPQYFNYFLNAISPFEVRIFDVIYLNLTVQDFRSITIQNSFWISICLDCYRETKAIRRVHFERYIDNDNGFKNYAQTQYEKYLRNQAFWLVTFYRDADEPNLIQEVLSAGKEIFTNKNCRILGGNLLYFSEIIIIAAVTQKYSNFTFGNADKDFSKSEAANNYKRGFVSFDSLPTSPGFLPLRQDSLVFFTCYGIKSDFIYEIYRRPFQINLWIFILGFLIFTAGFLQIGLNPQRHSRYQVSMLAINTLLEQVDLDRSGIPSNKKFRMVMLTWLLTSVVLSNAYKGIITSDLTALKPTEGLETFEELMDVDIMIPLIGKFRNGLDFTRPKMNYTATEDDKSKGRAKLFRNGTRHMFLRASDVGWLFNDYAEVTLMRRREKYRSFNITMPDENYADKLMRIAKTLTMPLNGKIKRLEEHVSECDRIAYLDFESRILHFRVPQSRQTDLHTRPFVMGKEKILNANYGWSVSLTAGKFLMAFLRSVYDAGFFDLIDRRFTALRSTKSDLKFLANIPRCVEQLTMTSNFSSTLFFLYTILSGFCVIAFLLERFSSLIKYYSYLCTMTIF